MKTLSLTQVKHVAALAKLSLTPSETARFQKQLSKVIDYVSKLNEVDTTGVEPTSQTTGLENVFRGDQADSRELMSQDEALSGSDKTRNGYFVVEKVIAKDE